MSEKADVKSSRMQKGRKTINYLQKLKDEGTPIVQMCPGPRDQFWTMAAEMADVDICPPDRSRRWLRSRNADSSSHLTGFKCVRNAAKIIHINFYMQTPTYASKEAAVANGALYMNCGADSLLPMGITNETLKYMTDNYLVVFGHIGALSGWQTSRQGGYKRLGQTAESAMEVFKMGYEYQENGMMAMTIELTPIEVTNAIAKKLRVPVISIAAGRARRTAAKCRLRHLWHDAEAGFHAKVYGEFFPFAVEAYMNWAEDVREHNYPEDKHGYHMDAAELEKFMNALEKF